MIPYPHGPTDLWNLVLLCARHHKHVHAGVIRLAEDDPPGRRKVVRRDGSAILDRSPPGLVA